MYTVYGLGTPNGFKISIALAELKQAYACKIIDIAKGEQFAPEFLALNANHKIPVLVDSAAEGGELVLAESGAILLYLAEKHGQFLPAATHERWATIQWLMFQMGGFGPMLGQLHHFKVYAPEVVPYGVNRYDAEGRRLYGVLNTQLAGKDYVVGQNYTIADMALYPWAYPHEQQGIDLADYPNVKAWFERVGARSAVQEGMAAFG